jgi:hypothetical protein
VASLVVFLCYFFSPRPVGQTLSVGPMAALTTQPGGAFVPITSQLGINFHHQRVAELTDIGLITGSGVSLSDFDGDGRTDIYLVNATPPGTTVHRSCALYLNQEVGGFRSIPEAGGADPPGMNMGAVSADYDNDGDLDLYVTSLGRDHLFRNDGRAHFEDVTDTAGIHDTEWSTAAAFADYDADGDLDLFVAHYLAYDVDQLPRRVSRSLDRDEPAAFNPYLYQSRPDTLLRNEGDGTFTDVTRQAGIGDHPGKGLGVAFTDLNADGRPDIYVVNDVSADALYLNRGDGTFVEIAVTAGVNDPRGGMGATIGDYDHDGALDLFVTHWQDELNVLYRNLGSLGVHVTGRPDLDLIFDDVTGVVGLGRSGLGFTGWGTVFLDADHDGDLDLYVTNGYTSPQPGDPSTCVSQRDQIFINESGRFVDRSAELLDGVSARAGRGLAAADLDGDGDLDLVRTSNNGPAVVLENRLARGHWLIVEPTGPLVIGSLIRVTSGGREQTRVIQAGTSYLSSEPPVAHFGLGAAAVADRVEVVWPDEHRRVWTQVPADRRFTAESMP